MRKALFSGVEHHTGDRDVGAQRDAGEHEDLPGIGCDGADTAHPAVSSDQFRGVDTRSHARYQLGEKLGVDVAERGFKAIGEAFNQNSKKRPATRIVAPQSARQFRGRIALYTTLQELVGDLLRRNTYQSGSPTFAECPAAPCPSA